MILIKNGHIKPIASPDILNGCLLLGDDGKILKVAQEIEAPAGCTVIDAEGRLVTPGCIDPHTHVGTNNAASSWEGKDYNEKHDPISPHMRAIDGFYPQDEYLSHAIAAGVTTVCSSPGSGNVIGGSVVAIKTWGKRADDMIVRNPVAMKCAFGENPKNAYGQSLKKAPITRMGIAALFRETLFKAREYQQAKDKGENPKFDMKMEAMLPVMRGEIPLKAHAHRADDILSSIRIAKEFGVKLILNHCTEGHLIADELAKEGYPAIIGPSLGSKSKNEVTNKTFETVGILHKAGLKVCVTTDAPVASIRHLALCAGLAVSAGLPEEIGWRAITLNPAEVMGIADRVGSLEEGKDADVVIWSADPLHTVGAYSDITIVNGQIVYNKADGGIQL